MHRREFLVSGATALAIGACQGGRALSASPLEFSRVSCDADRLTRVVVHTPGAETRKILAFDDGNGSHSMLGIDLIADEVVEQHRRFTALLREDQVEVLEFTSLLDEAIVHARDSRQLAPWLQSNAPTLAEHAVDLDAAMLVGSGDSLVYGTTNRGRRFRPRLGPLRFLFFTRDLAVMTPRGIVLCNLGPTYREFEAKLTAFVFRWCPRLNRIPIVFDAQAARIHLQGGDLIVADERTLLLGVNNLSDESAAPALARALGMDVVAVELRGDSSERDRGNRSPGWTPLRTNFLHLDTVFNLVAPRVGLAAPYFLEASHAGQDPLTEVLRGVAAESRSMSRGLEASARALTKIGFVRLYRAHDGVLDPDVRGLKLVDYLVARGGYTIHHVGGLPPAERDVKHFVESVHRELRLQAANVLATRPGSVIAADGNTATAETLRAAGIQVRPFPASELTRWHGGPHCLSLPLERTRST